MQVFSVSRHYTALLLIRMLAAAALLLSLFIIFVGLFALIPLVLFLIAAAFGYYYIKRRRSSIAICLNNDRLTISKGVWFFREDIIPKESVCYISCVQTPLLIALRAAEICLFTDRGAVHIPALDKPDADRLRSELADL